MRVRLKALAQQRKSLYYLDVETNMGVTRINAGGKPEAVSIGIAQVIGDQPVELVYYKEFKPWWPVDREAHNVHGLGNVYLVDKERFSADDAEEITQLLKDCKGCFAHNAQFDRAVLEHQFDLVGETFFPFKKLQCIQILARELGLPQKLGELYEKLFAKRRPMKHRADQDALDLALVHWAMLKRVHSANMKN